MVKRKIGSKNAIEIIFWFRNNLYSSVSYQAKIYFRKEQTILKNITLFKKKYFYGNMKH